MGDNFAGMNGSEIKGMPMTGDATGLMLARLFKHDKLKVQAGFAEVANAQAKYVREVRDRCPQWRRRKKRNLNRALAHADRTRAAIEWSYWRLLTRASAAPSTSKEGELATRETTEAHDDE